MPYGVFAGDREGFMAYVRTDAVCAWQLGKQRKQDGTGSGPEIGNAKWTCTSPIGFDGRKSRFHYGFGFGPRHQCCLGDTQWQTPEFFAADNAGNRLTRNSSLGEIGQSTRFTDIEHAVCGGGERGMIEAE